MILLQQNLVGAWKNNVQYVMHIRFDPINIPFYPIHIKYTISLQ